MVSFNSETKREPTASTFKTFHCIISSNKIRRFSYTVNWYMGAVTGRTQHFSVLFKEGPKSLYNAGYF